MTTCPRCGGQDGAHLAFCFATQLFEKLAASFANPSVTPVASVTATPDSALVALAGEVASLREEVERERERGDALEALLYERHEAPEPDQDQEGAAPEPGEPHRPQEPGRHEAPEDPDLTRQAADVLDGGPEPWWWNTPLGREARASTALDGETQSVGPDGWTGDQAAEATAETTAETTFTDATARIDAALDEPGMATQVAAVREEMAAADAELAERKRLIDRERIVLARLIQDTEGLTRTAVANAIKLSSGSFSNLINGKWYGPTAPARLREALNYVRKAREPREEVHDERDVAIDLFLLEAAEKDPNGWEETARIFAAWEDWRARHDDAPEVSHKRISNRLGHAGFTAARRTVNGRNSVRGYAGLRLRPLEGVSVRQGAEEGSDEGSDAEGDAGPLAPPEGPTRELLNPDAQRYERDETGMLLDAVREQGLSVKHVMSEFIASDYMGRGLTPVDPARVLRPPAPVVVEHPPGWDELPGRELAHTEVRRMAIKLVKEQGWGYKRRVGRNGKPKLRSPRGQMYALANTPSDYRGVKNTRADLRRLGADL